MDRVDLALRERGDVDVAVCATALPCQSTQGRLIPLKVGATAEFDGTDPGRPMFGEQLVDIGRGHQVRVRQEVDDFGAKGERRPDRGHVIGPTVGDDLPELRADPLLVCVVAAIIPFWFSGLVKTVA